MKNFNLSGPLLGYLSLFLFACGETKKEEPATTPVDKEAVKQEIQARENEFAALYNDGELKDIGYYADDAISYYQNREPLVGKPAIVDFLKTDILSTTNTNKISFQTNEVFVADNGNQVLELGAFKVVDSANVLINSGNYMSLFEKRNGKYVCLRDMSASDRPIP